MAQQVAVRQMHPDAGIGIQRRVRHQKKLVAGLETFEVVRPVREDGPVNGRPEPLR